MKIFNFLCCKKTQPVAPVKPCKLAPLKKALSMIATNVVAHKKALIGATVIGAAAGTGYAFRENITSMVSSLLGTTPEPSFLSKYSFGYIA